MSNQTPDIAWVLEEDNQAIMRAAVKYSEKFGNAPKTELYKLDVKRVARDLESALDEVLEGTVLKALQGSLLNTKVVQESASERIQQFNKALGDGLSDGRIFNPHTYSPATKSETKVDENPDFLDIGKFSVNILGKVKLDVTAIVYSALHASGLITEVISSDRVIYAEKSALEEAGYIFADNTAALKQDTPKSLKGHSAAMDDINSRRLTF